MGLKGLSDNFERVLGENHPSLAKGTSLKVADFFTSKQAKSQLTNQEMEVIPNNKENVHENLRGGTITAQKSNKRKLSDIADLNSTPIKSSNMANRIKKRRRTTIEVEEPTRSLSKQ